MKLAVIPARGGSKRIPDKNIRSFCGKPVIQYSIAAALQSGVFDRVVVSTDSERIARLSRACGAEVPFLRPPELSDDFTPTIPVIRHAVDAVESDGTRVAHACCVYATAPFVSAADIATALRLLLENSEMQFSFPVTTFPFPIFRALKREGERVSMYYPEHRLTRSQDLPEAWHDAGQFYWGTAEAWRDCSSMFVAACTVIPIPRYRVQDIDTEEDWTRAELMYQMELTNR